MTQRMIRVPAPARCLCDEEASARRCLVHRPSASGWRMAIKSPPNPILFQSKHLLQAQPGGCEFHQASDLHSLLSTLRQILAGGLHTLLSSLPLIPPLHLTSPSESLPSACFLS